MERIDLFVVVHKALRAELFASTTLSGRTDFRSASEAARATSSARALVGLLEEHAGHEDAVVLPELAALAPELHAAIAADHAKLDALHREITALATRIEGSAADAERVALGRRLYDRIGRLTADHLHHMQREEVEVNRTLWAHRSDEALAALHARIVRRIEPARMAFWLTALFAASSLPERATLLASVRATVSPALFGELTAPARAALGEAGWSEASQAAGFVA
jgi:hypothetical protein